MLRLGLKALILCPTTTTAPHATFMPSIGHPGAYQGEKIFLHSKGRTFVTWNQIFFGGGNHETRYKVLFILFMLFVSVVVTIPEVPVFFYIFLFAQIPCLCLSQSEATWRYHFYYFEY